MYGSALEAPMSATANLDLQATIAPDLLARLQALAEKQGISLDDALGQAVGLAEIVQETRHEPNADVYIVRNGRRFRVNFQQPGFLFNSHGRRGTLRVVRLSELL